MKSRRKPAWIFILYLFFISSFKNQNQPLAGPRDSEAGAASHVAITCIFALPQGVGQHHSRG